MATKPKVTEEGSGINRQFTIRQTGRGSKWATGGYHFGPTFTAQGGYWDAALWIGMRVIADVKARSYEDAKAKAIEMFNSGRPAGVREYFDGLGGFACSCKGSRR